MNNLFVRTTIKEKQAPRTHPGNCAILLTDLSDWVSHCEKNIDYSTNTHAQFLLETLSSNLL